MGVRGVIVDIDGSPHAVTDYDEATGEMALYPGKLTDYNYADAEYKISIGGSLFTTGGDGGQQSCDEDLRSDDVLEGRS